MVEETGRRYIGLQLEVQEMVENAMYSIREIDRGLDRMFKVLRDLNGLKAHILHLDARERGSKPLTSPSHNSE